MQQLAGLATSVVNLVLPPRCPGCSAIVQDPNSFCACCWRELHFLGPPWCARCQRPLDTPEIDGSICGPCLARPPVFDGVRAAVAYTDLSGRIPIRLKYGGRIGLAELVASQLQRHLPSDEEPHLVIPVPLHRGRLWARGFNQSVLIAAALARGTAHELLPDGLIRVRATAPLKGKNPKQRRDTLRGTIRVAAERKHRLHGRAVILVDDVLTTGATAETCARALKRAGAAHVLLFCWARVLD